MDQFMGKEHVQYACVCKCSLVSKQSTQFCEVSPHIASRNREGLRLHCGYFNKYGYCVSLLIA